jgi:predicted PurR-regulated permease PerM
MTPTKSEVSDQTAKRFFLVVLITATVLLCLVIRPMASALFLAAVLAGALWPLQQGLTRRVRGRRGIAAGVLVLGVVIAIVGPVVSMSAFVVKEGADGVKFVSQTVRSEGVSGLIERLPESLQKITRPVLDQIPRAPGTEGDQGLEKQVTGQGSRAAAAVGAAVAATGSLLFQATLMVIALFFMLVQGKELVTWLDGTLPLKRGQTQELLIDFKKVSYSVLVSSLATAAVQALAAMIGYFIARVPHPIFFAAVTFFVAFIPAIGAASVCLLAALILLVTGHPYMALFLSIWGVLVVGLVDNVVKPWLIKSGMQMNGAIVFFALIGGLGAFGTVGLLMGPMIVSLFLALLRMYRGDFRA